VTDQHDDAGARRPVEAGSQIAGYRLEERIGAGGMAVVFRAYDSRLDRRVALKVLAPELALDSGFRQRFIRESRAAAAVDDPHIIPVFDAGEADGVLFLAMRYVRGGDVRSLIDRSGPLPPDRVADIVSQVASALDAAHGRGLVHRDIKPANMLLESRPASDLRDHVYLSDFGLTKTSLGTSLALTATGEFLGTLEYVAPEQIEGRALDGRCDQYGLACSAFEMLCGQPPFRGQQGLSLMDAHLNQSPPQIRRLRPDLPARVQPVLSRALAKAADDRYASCGEFAAALRQAVAGQSANLDRAGATHPETETALPRVGTSAAAAPAAATRENATFGGSAGTSSTRPAGQRTPAFPGLTDPVREPAGPGPGRPWWRSPTPIAGVCVLAVALAGGGYALATRGHRTAGAARPPTTLTAPGCTQAIATAPQLTTVRTSSLAVPGAFGVAVIGRYAFVSGGNAVTVLHTAGGTTTPVRTISIAGANKGDAITHDGRYLLAAAGSGAVVISVQAALDGAPDPVVGRLVSPSGTGAAEVALSPDDTYAFVTVQNDAEVAVFNLRSALTAGFGGSDFVGDVRVGPSPVGVAASGDSVYVANEGSKVLSVLSMSAAERHPSNAVTATVTAGCSPARLLVSADGRVLWVTAPGSDAVLGFSTAKLHSDPARALIAKVNVGAAPLGLALTTGGSRMIVVDSDQNNARGLTSSLAVVDMAHALSGKPAVLGYIPTGHLPREVAIEAGGLTALVTVTDSGQVQAVNLGDLP